MVSTAMALGAWRFSISSQMYRAHSKIEVQIKHVNLNLKFKFRISINRRNVGVIKEQQRWMG